MKKLILTGLLGAAMLTAAAEESSIIYTYAGDEVGAWGKEKSEIYDVAIHITDPVLVGKKITAIRATINPDEGVEATSVWLSKELTLAVNDAGVKVTVPDTYSAEVPVEQIILNDLTAGQLSSTLETPYELTSDGIYVGYSLTVPSLRPGQSLDEGQRYPILLSPSDNPESLYIRASRDILKWTAYNQRLGGAAATIYVTFEGDFAEYSVGIKNLPTAYAAVGEENYIKAEVSNVGAAPATQLGYTYSIDGQEFEGVVDMNGPLLPDFVHPYEVSFPIAAVSEIGEYDFNLTITSVDGQENDNVAASASCLLSVLPFVPQHRPMVEEFTGTWCGWCTRGYWAMEALNELYGDDVVLAAYHASDPMETPGAPLDVQNFPNASLNRGALVDPYYANANDGFGMKDEVVQSMQTSVPASIDVKAVWADNEKTSISVKATSSFFENKTNAGYLVGYLLINSGLKGEGSDWLQKNYYSGLSDYKGTDLEVLTKWPASVPLVYNDVVVDITAMMGVRGSVPADVEFGVPYDTEFSYDIASNKIIQDKDQLYVAAFILNPNGTILNAIKTKVTEGAAVDAVEAEPQVVSVEYYDLSGIRVTKPQNGLFIKVSKMADGTVRTSKVTR